MAAARDTRQPRGARRALAGMLSLGAGVALRAAGGDVLEAGLGRDHAAERRPRGALFSAHARGAAAPRDHRPARVARGSAVLARLARSARPRGADAGARLRCVRPAPRRARAARRAARRRGPERRHRAARRGCAHLQVWTFENGDDVTRVLSEPSRELRTASALWLTLGGETLRPCVAACAGPISG